MVFKIKKTVLHLQTMFFMAAIGILTLPAKIFAAATITVKNMPSRTVPTDIDVDAILGNLRNYFFGAVIVACIFMVLWGAFDLATSGGSEEKVKSAKHRILYASIGLVIAAMSMAIVGILLSILK
jgi:hypothetical protein